MLNVFAVPEKYASTTDMNIDLLVIDEPPVCSVSQYTGCLLPAIGKCILQSNKIIIVFNNITMPATVHHHYLINRQICQKVDTSIDTRLLYAEYRYVQRVCISNILG